MSIRIENIKVSVDGVELPMSVNKFPSPVVVGSGITISWSRPSITEHSGPTNLAFEMIRPAWSRVPAPPIGGIVRVTATWNYDQYPGNAASGLLFLGQIDSITERPRERTRPGFTDITGYSRFQITATDAIGVLQRSKIGAPPWPAESNLARVSRLLALFPTWLDTQIIASMTTGGLDVAPLDVDNRSAWEVLAQTLPVTDSLFAVGSNGLVQAIPTVTNGLLSGGTIYVQGGLWRTAGPDLGVLDASAIPDVERSDAWDTGVATVTVQHVFSTWPIQTTDPPEYAERSTTLGRRSAPGQALTLSAHRFRRTATETSQALSELDVSNMFDPSMVDLARRILASASDMPVSLPTLHLDLARETAGHACLARWMIPAGTERMSAAAFIRGLPSDAPALHKIMGGTLTLSTDPDEQTLDVQLQPYQITGYPGMTWADAAAHPAITFGTADGAWTNSEYLAYCNAVTYR